MDAIDRLRDRVSSSLLRHAATLATNAGWAGTLHRLGKPNMYAGLLALRDRGASPQSAIDGGACLGTWTRLFLNVFPRASVLMIEPQERHAATLQQHADEDPDRVKFAPSLVGPPSLREVPFIVMDDPFGGTGSSVFPENSDIPRHVVIMPVVTLDELIAAHSVAAPDFINWTYRVTSSKCSRAPRGCWSTPNSCTRSQHIGNITRAVRCCGVVMDGCGDFAYDLFDFCAVPMAFAQVDLMVRRHRSCSEIDDAVHRRVCGRTITRRICRSERRATSCSESDRFQRGTSEDRICGCGQLGLSRRDGGSQPTRGGTVCGLLPRSRNRAKRPRGALLQWNHCAWCSCGSELSCLGSDFGRGG